MSLEDMKNILSCLPKVPGQDESFFFQYVRSYEKLSESENPSSQKEIMKNLLDGALNNLSFMGNSYQNKSEGAIADGNLDTARMRAKKKRICEEWSRCIDASFKNIFLPDRSE